MKEKLEQIKQLMTEVLNAGAGTILVISAYDKGETFQVAYHGLNYKDAKDVARSFGLQQLRKLVISENLTTLSATEDNIGYTFYSDELPPTCRKVKVKKKIPKTAVTTFDNEFVEIEETVIECGPSHEQNENLTN